MPSLPARALMVYSRAVIKRNTLTQQQLTPHLRRTMNNSPLPPLLPAGLRVASFTALGAEGNVVLRGDWLQTKSATRAILYLHGGGYLAGITRTYHSLCGKLAQELQADVYLPDYRLAPEHPFPAAVDDALLAYELMLSHGWSPANILVAGDSAGGGLTLALLLKLRDENKPLPAAAVVFSPFADMTATAKSHAGNDATDAMLSEHMLAVAENIYVREAENLRHPYASPVYGDFTGLPPLLVTVSESECLRDDAHEVVACAKKAGVPVSFISRPDLVHVWPIFWPLLPEAREDVKKVVAFVRRVVKTRY
jgi:monoterpene epsilon-lactone hydrolase